jgi:hypothetical protein
MSRPSSGPKKQILLPTYVDHSSTLKMEEKYSSEMSVDFQRTSRRCIPEDKTLHNHRCENLKSYILRIW